MSDLVHSPCFKYIYLLRGAAVRPAPDLEGAAERVLGAGLLWYWGLLCWYPWDLCWPWLLEL